MLSFKRADTVLGNALEHLIADLRRDRLDTDAVLQAIRHGPGNAIEHLAADLGATADTNGRSTIGDRPGDALEHR